MNEQTKQTNDQMNEQTKTNKITKEGRKGDGGM